MTTDQHRQAYRSFFLKSEAGAEFLKFLKDSIDNQHRYAEHSPELARDFTQRAKGLREVQDHINSLVAERSTPTK